MEDSHDLVAWASRHARAQRPARRSRRAELAQQPWAGRSGPAVPADVRQARPAAPSSRRWSETSTRGLARATAAAGHARSTGSGCPAASPRPGWRAAATAAGPWTRRAGMRWSGDDLQPVSDPLGGLVGQPRTRPHPPLRGHAQEHRHAVSPSGRGRLSRLRPPRRHLTPGSSSCSRAGAVHG